MSPTLLRYDYTGCMIETSCVYLALVLFYKLHMGIILIQMIHNHVEIRDSFVSKASTNFLIVSFLHFYFHIFHSLHGSFEGPYVHREAVTSDQRRTLQRNPGSSISLNHQIT